MNLATKHLNQADKDADTLARSSENCFANRRQRSFEGLVFQGDREIQVRRFFNSHKWEDTEDSIIMLGLDKLWKPSEGIRQPSII